jgi:hypothetical protein
MLQDGIQLAAGSTAKHVVTEKGTTFPLTPEDGQKFHLTATVGQYSPDEYWYDAATSTWISGDISGVTAGVGLTGGGQRGNVSLALDQAWLDQHSLPKAGGTLSGPLVLAADPASAMQAVTKQYLESMLQNLNTFLLKTGGIMTGSLTLQADPTTALQAATKQYVDAVSQSIAAVSTSVSAMLPKAGGTMTGQLNVLSPVADSNAATKLYVDTLHQYVDSTFVPRAGGVMTGILSLSGDPVSALNAATKQYVDSLGTKFQDILLTLNQPGEIMVVNGTARWYPPKNIKLLDIQAFIGVAPTGQDIHFTVKASGVAVLPAINIVAGQNYSSAMIVPDATNLLGPTNYLTLDINQVGSTVIGSDLLVRIRYNYV